MSDDKKSVQFVACAFLHCQGEINFGISENHLFMNVPKIERVVVLVGSELDPNTKAGAEAMILFQLLTRAAAQVQPVGLETRSVHELGKLPEGGAN